MKARSERIAERRRQQPVTELERKAKKARGRCSRSYWLAEEIDLAQARGAELMKLFVPVE